MMGAPNFLQPTEKKQFNTSTIEHKKRYVVAPRLLKELEGTAKMAVRAMNLRDPQWVAKPRGGLHSP